MLQDVASPPISAPPRGLFLNKYFEAGASLAVAKNITRTHFLILLEASQYA